MAAIMSKITAILLALAACIASTAAQAPPNVSPYPVQHWGNSPAPSTCFNQGPGVLHAWMDLLADVFCKNIDNYEFDNTRNNTVTAIWSDDKYPYNAMFFLFRDSWEFYLPHSVLLQVGIAPGQEDALTLHHDECKAAFSVIIDGCNTDVFDGKQGGQLVLGRGTGDFWGTDQLFYTLDANYQGTPTNVYYSLIEETSGTVDIFRAAIDAATDQECS